MVNPQARAAAEAPLGDVLIGGAPGADTERVLLGRILALLWTGVPPEEILLLDAGQGSAERYRRMLSGLSQEADRVPEQRPEARQQRAALYTLAGPASRILVCTPEQFAVSFLRRTVKEGRSPYFSIWDDGRARAVLSRLAEELGKRGTSVGAPTGADRRQGRKRGTDWAAMTNRERTGRVLRFQRWLSTELAKSLVSYRLDLDEPWKEELLQLYRQEKEWQDALDVPDLVRNAANQQKAMVEAAGRDEFRGIAHVLCANFQDFTEVECELVQWLSIGGKSLTAFCNANLRMPRYGSATSPEAWFRSYRGNCERIQLPSSSLQRPELRAAGTRIAASLNQADLLDSNPMAPSLGRLVSPGLRLTVMEGARPHLYRVVSERAAEMLAGGIDPGDIAILLPGRTVSDHLVGYLAAMGLELELKDGISVSNAPYGRAEIGPGGIRSNADRVLAMLACLTNPHDSECFRVAASASARPQDKPLNQGDLREVEKVSRGMKLGLGVAAALHGRGLGRRTNARRDLLYFSGAWQRLDNMLEEGNAAPHVLIKEAERLLVAAQGSANGGPWEDAEVDNLVALAERLPPGTDEDPRMALVRFLDSVSPAIHSRSMLLPPRDQGSDGGERLTLMPVRASRGLKWKVVFLVGVDDQNMAVSDDSDRAGQLVEANRRVLYAALSRAQEQFNVFISSMPERVSVNNKGRTSGERIMEPAARLSSGWETFLPETLGDLLQIERVESWAGLPAL